MDCHLNCHGELSLLVPLLAVVPIYIAAARKRIGTIITGARARWATWRKSA